MSDLTVLKETEDYVASWIEHYSTRKGGPVVLARLFRCTADEICSAFGKPGIEGARRGIARFRGTNGIAEWAMCVAYLERAALSAEAVSEEYCAQRADADAAEREGLSMRMDKSGAW